MEVNWSTFVLEIINFLVLLWILKRFLYQPVLQIVARRQDAIQQTILDAEVLREEAQGVQKLYQNRLQDWQEEREKALISLQQEIATERGRLQKALAVELENEREKVRVLADQQQEQTRHGLEVMALAQGAQFASRFLKPFASPALEVQLIDMALRQLSILSDTELSKLKPTIDDVVRSIIVTSAFRLTDVQCEQIEEALKNMFGARAAPEYRQDGDLGAGLCITAGAWVLKANLRDELASFAELSQHGGL